MTVARAHLAASATRQARDSGNDTITSMSGGQEVAVVLSDRVFWLTRRGDRQGELLARLSSLGSSEMFWEIFKVEPLEREHEVLLLEPDPWRRCEYRLWHQRTGAELEVFSAGGMPPRRTQGGDWVVDLRGTYMFIPAKKSPVSLAQRMLRWLVGR